MPDGALVESLASIVSAGGACSPVDAGKVARTVLRHQGKAFVEALLAECQRRNLKGNAARELLNVRRDAENARRAEEHRLDVALALKMSRHVAPTARREPRDVLTDRARGIRRLMEDEGLTREEIWSMFEQLSRQKFLRGQILMPLVLRHYWKRHLVHTNAAQPAELNHA